MSESTEIPPPPRPAEYEGVDRSTGTVLVVVGVALVLLGLVLLANPFAAIWILGVLIGVSLIVGGLAELASTKGTPGPRWPSLVVGVLVIIAGIAAAVWPDATLLVLALLIGFRTLVNGVISIGIGLNIRRYAA